MHIHSIQIDNYKSFLSSPEIQFAPGFNVIVGRNNVGKTALAEALSLRYENKPHRSIKTCPTPSTRYDPASKVHVVLGIEKEELFELSFGQDCSFSVPARPIKNVSQENFWSAIPNK
ncbi:MAG: AAA family ATPase [bacterium]